VRRPDHIRLSALVRSRSTQFIVHASSQLGHAGPWPPEARSFFAIVAGFLIDILGSLKLRTGCLSILMFLTPLAEVTP